MTILQSFIFDVIMGSFKNAKLCKLVGLYLFSKISVLIDSDNGSSYRNNGLAAIYSANTTKLGRLRKIIIAPFKNEVTNLVETDFLDATSFNLSTVLIINKQVWVDTPQH